MSSLLHHGAAPADQGHRLAHALRELLDQVPLMQRRYRDAVARVHPDDAVGLVDAWSEFQRALTDARYDPACGGLFGPGAAPPDAVHAERVLEVAGALSDARVRLREQIRAADRAGLGARPPELGILLSRWRLLQRGERRLRGAFVRALSALPAEDGVLLRNLAPLAASYVRYLAADRALAGQWTATGPASVAALERQLAHATDLRDEIDRLVAGFGVADTPADTEPFPDVAEPPTGVAASTAGAPEPPAGAGASPTGAAEPAAGPPPGGELRAVLEALHDGYPELIAGCRRVLVALGELGGLAGAGVQRRELLTAWGRYDDALVAVESRAGGGPPVEGGGAADADDRAEAHAAITLRDEFVSRLGEAQAWVGERSPATGAPGAGAGPLPRPPVTAVTRPRVPHRLRWLADQPLVNAEEFELYVASPWPAGRTVADGVPGPWLFLVGRLDGAGLAGEARAGSLLRVKVRPGAAIDGSALHQRPTELRDLFTAPDSYLLPVAWLAGTRVVGAYRVDVSGRPHPDELPDELAGQALASFPDDARHGASGLPNEVVYWPSRRMTGAAVAYALVPDPPPRPVPDRLRLYRERPRTRPEHRLVELYVGRGRAIDITTTVEQLRELPRLHSIAGVLHARGEDLVLPRRSYASVRIRRVWRPGHGWLAASRFGSPSLAGLLGEAPGPLTLSYAGR